MTNAVLESSCRRCQACRRCYIVRLLYQGPPLTPLPPFPPPLALVDLTGHLFRIHALLEMPDCVRNDCQQPGPGRPVAQSLVVPSFDASFLRRNALPSEHSAGLRGSATEDEAIADVASSLHRFSAVVTAHLLHYMAEASGGQMSSWR